MFFVLHLIFKCSSFLLNPRMIDSINQIFDFLLSSSSWHFFHLNQIILAVIIFGQLQFDIASMPIYEGYCLLVVVAHDGDISKIDHLWTDLNIRWNEYALHWYFHWFSTSKVNCYSAAYSFLTVRYHCEIYLLFLLLHQYVHLFLKCQNISQFLRYLYLVQSLWFGQISEIKFSWKRNRNQMPHTAYLTLLHCYFGIIYLTYTFDDVFSTTYNFDCKFVNVNSIILFFFVLNRFVSDCYFVRCTGFQFQFLFVHWKMSTVLEPALTFDERISFVFQLYLFGLLEIQVIGCKTKFYIFCRYFQVDKSDISCDIKLEDMISVDDVGQRQTDSSKHIRPKFDSKISLRSAIYFDCIGVRTPQTLTFFSINFKKDRFHISIDYCYCFSHFCVNKDIAKC